MDSLERGRSLEQTVHLSYMNTQKTAEMDSRGLKALLPKGFDWKEAGLQTDQEPINELTLSTQMQEWKAFITA